MEKVLFDCDNTFGLPEKDIDDGLTLLYLLRHPSIELRGLSLSHGNGTIGEVRQATEQFLNRFRIDLPCYLGEERGQISEAGKYLAESVAESPHEMTIIATGALTNLAAAYKHDAHFFNNVKQIILMGGVTKPLIINDKKISELNFSVDAEATKLVLLSKAPITIMTGHFSGQAFFSDDDLKRLMNKVKEKNEFQHESTDALLLDWFEETIELWCDWNDEHFGWTGFCNWDMTTAVYLTHPELFVKRTVYLNGIQEELSSGKMVLSDKQTDYQINMPETLTSVSLFNKHIIQVLSDV